MDRGAWRIIVHGVAKSRKNDWSDLAYRASVDLASRKPSHLPDCTLLLPGLLQPSSSHRPSLTIFL